jgi:methylmalonyl-CoA mutase N-terminal domain/subunit
MRVRTASGIPLPECFSPEDVPSATHGLGEPPFTRGITRGMYRERPWVMGQYAGFGSTEETNARYRTLLEQGSTGFSVALDLPTQMGYDSDAPRAHGEVGRVGVAIDSVEDMERLFDGLPLGPGMEIRTTANSIGPMWLALVVAHCRRHDVDPAEIRIFIQNDVLKEYIARGTYIYAPEQGLRLSADVIEHCARHLPRWTPLAVSGYHIRESGADAVQEVAFTFANAIAYCRAVAERGVAVDDFAGSLYAFLSSGTDLLEEVAKFRAARKTWDQVMRDLGAVLDDTCALRIFAYTAGSQMAAQEPYNNVVRVALAALAAVLGGVQTLTTSSFDEALSMPSEDASRLALRTQQILLHESGVPRIADALGGSYAVEWLTNELHDRITRTLAEIDHRGGALACIESGWFQSAISEAAYRQQLEVDDGNRTIVGVNLYRDDSALPGQAFAPDLRDSERRQVARVIELRERRDEAGVAATLADLRDCAAGTGNLMEPMIAAADALATIGEMCDALRAVWGSYRPPGGV